MTTSAPLISDGGLEGLEDPGEAGLSDYELAWATRSFSPLLGHRLLVKDVSRREQWDYKPLCFVEAASNNMSGGITLYYIIQSSTLKQSFCFPNVDVSAGDASAGRRRLEDPGHPHGAPRPPRAAHHQVHLPPDQPDLQLLLLPDGQVPQ